MECSRCDGQGEVFDRKDFWGNDLTVQCPECGGDYEIGPCPDSIWRAIADSMMRGGRA